jgi:hypothetical protein
MRRIRADLIGDNLLNPLYLRSPNCSSANTEWPWRFGKRKAECRNDALRDC